ncbi:MAG: YceD family protein [Thiomonas sp.]
MTAAPSKSASDRLATSRPPHALALFDFARTDGELHGAVALSALSRLRDLLASDAGAPVQWTLRGFQRQRAGMRPQAMVALRVHAELGLICQRCLQEMTQEIDDAAEFRLVIDEPPLTLEELEAEDEALPAENPIDVLELIEDQLILALPLVPMHAACPDRQTAEPSSPPADAGEREERQHPFANLRELMGNPKKR